MDRDRQDLMFDFNAWTAPDAVVARKMNFVVGAGVGHLDDVTTNESPVPLLYKSGRPSVAGPHPRELCLGD